MSEICSGLVNLNLSECHGDRASMEIELVRVHLKSGFDAQFFLIPQCRSMEVIGLRSRSCTFYADTILCSSGHSCHGRMLVIMTLTPARKL